MIGIALAGLGAALLLMSAVWLGSLRYQDASLVDRFWGFGFIVVVLVYQALLGFPGYGWLVVVLVTLWGARLSLHLTWRNWGHGEDARYRAMREAGGPQWPQQSLFTVFWLQGLILWIIAAPLFHAIAFGSLEAWLSPWAMLGIAVFFIGFLYETVADTQLLMFKSDPDNRGRVFDQGLWRFSRHPNYFGEILVWWGLWGLAVAAGGWWTVFAPLLVTGLLARVSGVPLLEKRMRETRPEYAEYAARTNALIPGPKKHPAGGGDAS